jgi:hypothetical protein
MTIKIFELESVKDFFGGFHILISLPLALALFACSFSLLVAISLIVLPFRILLEILIHIALKIRESWRNKERSEQLLESLRRDMDFT